MYANYLSRSTHFLIGLSLFVAWWFSWWTVFFLLTIFYISLFILFRRQHREELLLQKEVREIIVSPVNGRVQEVGPSIDHPFFGKKVRWIRILVAPWNEYGVLLPAASEIHDFHFRPSKGPLRWLKPDTRFIKDALGVSVTLRTRTDDLIGIQFLRCFLGRWPKLAIVPGDRGRIQSRVGTLPFGGTVLLYIPENYEILVQEGEDLVAGSSFVGATNGIPPNSGPNTDKEQDLLLS